MFHDIFAFSQFTFVATRFCKIITHSPEWKGSKPYYLSLFYVVDYHATIVKAAQSRFKRLCGFYYAWSNNLRLATIASISCSLGPGGISEY